MSEWVTIEAERVLYVERGVNTILCDRGFSGPVTLLVKVQARDCRSVAMTQVSAMADLTERLRDIQQYAINLSDAARSTVGQSADEIERMQDVLHRIVARAPDLDSLPLDQAFRTLREITEQAHVAISQDKRAND